MTMNLVAKNNTHLFSYSYQISMILMSLGGNQNVIRIALPPEALQGKICLLFLFKFQNCTPWPADTSFFFKASSVLSCLSGYISFFCSQMSLCLPLKRTLEITLKAQPDNLGQPPRLRIFNLVICAKCLFVT